MVKDAEIDDDVEDETSEISKSGVDDYFSEESIRKTSKELKDKLQEKVVEKKQKIVGLIDIDQALAALAITVFLFSTITGILAQKFNEIEQDANKVERKASVLHAEARSLEAIENQEIIAEEILLMEIRTNSLETEIAKSNRHLIQFALEDQYENYHVAMLEKDLYTYINSGVMIHLGLLHWCYLEFSCETEEIEREGKHNVMKFSYLRESEDAIDRYLEALEFLLDDNTGLFYEIEDPEDLNQLDFEVGYFDDMERNIVEIYVLEYEDGMLGILSDLNDEFEEFSDIANNLELGLTMNESFEKNATSNYLAALNHKNTHELKASIAELSSNSQGVQENITLVEYYASQASSFQNISSYHRNIKENIAQNLSFYYSSITAIDIERNKISNTYVYNGMDEVSSKSASVEYKLYELEESLWFANDAIDDMNELREQLLSGSIAYALGLVDDDGNYTTEFSQDNFYDSMHSESEDKFNDSNSASQQSEDIRNQVSSVSRSVALVSIGNVTLGLAGVMGTKTDAAIGTLRSIGVLLIGGISSGVAGILSSLNLFF